MAIQHRSTRRKTKAYRRRATKKRIGVYVALVSIILIISACIYILQQPQLRIGSVSVVGTQDVDSESVTHEVEQLVSGMFYSVFPRDSIFWYPHAQIETTLMSRHPEIQTITTNLEDFDQLVVDITERVEAYTLEAQGVRYEVEQNGIIFSIQEDAQASTTRTFSSYAYDENPVVLTKQLEGVEDLQAFDEFVDDLGTLGIMVDHVRFENKILAVLSLADSRTRLVVRPDADYEAVQNVLKEVLTYKEFEFNRHDGGFTQPVEYINLRFGNKIFYCYTGDECQTNYQTN